MVIRALIATDQNLGLRRPGAVITTITTTTIRERLAGEAGAAGAAAAGAEASAGAELLLPRHTSWQACKQWRSSRAEIPKVHPSDTIFSAFAIVDQGIFDWCNVKRWLRGGAKAQHSLALRLFLHRLEADVFRNRTEGSGVWCKPVQYPGLAKV